jgi:S-adenosylmethionine:tRNA ribosyltransferase-isomerase
VVNRSRVRPARLLARRATGGQVELLLVRDLGEGIWEALLRPARRIRVAETLAIAPGLEARLEPGSPGPDGRRRVRIEASAGDLSELIDHHGHVPLPPYIRRPDRPADRQRYQTVYAREPGSVAAPTAGLHFTEATLRALAARGIEQAEVVLHVGPGTFLPVRTEDVHEHRLASEAYQVPAETAAAIARARARNGRVVAVGTTTTRTLESVANAAGEIGGGSGETDLVIIPGFRFKVVDALITNFHLPRSSLLLLVSAFAGLAETRRAYAEAVAQGYRFYSYGDAMLVL